MRERNFKQILFIISFQHNTSAQDSDTGDEKNEIFCCQTSVPTNQVCFASFLLQTNTNVHNIEPGRRQFQN